MVYNFFNETMLHLSQIDITKLIYKTARVITYLGGENENHPTRSEAGNTLTKINILPSFNCVGEFISHWGKGRSSQEGTPERYTVFF